MAFITIWEIIDIIIMTLLIGFIFSTIFKKPHHDGYDLTNRRKISWENLKFAMLITGPAIILHELGHKFVAMGLGQEATFFSAISLNKIVHGMQFLDFAAILMIFAAISAYFSFGFIFIVPGYVAHTVSSIPWHSSAIAFAGPAMNLILWLGAWILLKQPNNFNENTKYALILTKKINMFLFFFNMIPLGFFDGAQVFSGLIQTFF